MANKKDDLSKTASDMVAAWASTVDSLLQQWLACGEAEDRLGLAIASVKLAQVGHMLTRYFKEVGEHFIEGETELRAARQAVEQIDATVRAAMAKAGVGKNVSGQAPEKKDASLN